MSVRPLLPSRGAPARRAAVILLAGLATLAAPAAASGHPTANLVPACHNRNAPYGFTAWLSGFPPNTPFTATLRYQGSTQTFSYSTDSDGNSPPFTYYSQTPIGPVEAMTTATVNGQTITFRGKLANPCYPPVPLAFALCGDGSFAQYDFTSLSDCQGYAERFQAGAQPAGLSVTPVCREVSPQRLVGAISRVVGLAVNATYVASIRWDSGWFSGLPSSDRFGIIGPVPFDTGITKYITVSVVGPGLFLTRTITVAACG